MADPVETTQGQGTATVTTPVETPAPVPATPATPKTYSEAEVKAAAEQARREAQAAKDREVAGLHQHYQRQLQGRTQAAKAAIQQGGRQDAEQWEQSLSLWEDAQYGRQMRQIRDAQAEWDVYVTESVRAAGFDPADPRLQNAADAVDLAAKIAKAVREDAVKEREAERQKALASRQSEIQAQIDSGNLNVMGGAPAPQQRTNPAELEAINAELLTLLREPTKNKARIAELKAKRDKLKG